MVVGLDLEWPNAEYVSIQSDRSLADGDIIVVHHSFYSFTTNNQYLGKRSFPDSTSFQIRERIAHWKNEIVNAYSANKTIIVILVEREDFYIQTGKKEHSGTGRNRHTTNLVEGASNYDLIPVKFEKLTNASGSKTKKERVLRPIESYWQSMESASSYRVTFEDGKMRPILRTADGNRVIAAEVTGKGRMVFVPDFQMPDESIEFDSKGNEVVTKIGLEFARRLEAAFVAIDNECRSDLTKTEPPQWMQNGRFRLPREAEIEAEILSISKEVEALGLKHESKSKELADYASVKDLLYEKGAQLESSIRTAFEEMGFEVSNLNDGASEFDFILKADGRRYIGEAEGKDDKAISVDKISQLERNIGEDFERDEIKEIADGILVGNAFRLKEPMSRENFFTEKVLKAAARTKVRLIRSIDLFAVVQEIRRGNSDLASSCRKAIHDQPGQVVKFPTPEKLDESVSEKAAL